MFCICILTYMPRLNQGFCLSSVSWITFSMWTSRSWGKIDWQSPASSSIGLFYLSSVRNSLCWVSHTFTMMGPYNWWVILAEGPCCSIWYKGIIHTSYNSIQGLWNHNIPMAIFRYENFSMQPTPQILTVWLFWNFTPIFHIDTNIFPGFTNESSSLEFQSVSVMAQYIHNHFHII